MAWEQIPLALDLGMYGPDLGIVHSRRLVDGKVRKLRFDARRTGLWSIKFVRVTGYQTRGATQRRDGAVTGTCLLCPSLAADAARNVHPMRPVEDSVQKRDTQDRAVWVC